MQNPFLLELSKSLDYSYRKVIDTVACRVQGIHCVLMGPLAAPAICREPPAELDVVVRRSEDRDKVLHRLRGAFRPQPDGSVWFVDGGNEFEMRPRIYTPQDLAAPGSVYMTWYCSARPIEYLPSTFRITERRDLLAFFLLREIAEDDEYILQLLRIGIALSDQYDIPASGIIRASALYAELLNQVAENLEHLEGEL